MEPTPQEAPQQSPPQTSEQTTKPWTPTAELMCVLFCIYASSTVEANGWSGFFDQWWYPLMYSVGIGVLAVWAIRRAARASNPGFAVARCCVFLGVSMLLCFAYPSDMLRMVVGLGGLAYTYVVTRASKSEAREHGVEKQQLRS